MHSHGEETPEEEISPRSRSSSALVLWHPKTPCSAWCASGRTCSFDCRFFHMDLHSDPLPDFVKLAEALGCAVFRKRFAAKPYINAASKAILRTLKQ